MLEGRRVVALRRHWERSLEHQVRSVEVSERADLARLAEICYAEVVLLVVVGEVVVEECWLWVVVADPSFAVVAVGVDCSSVCLASL